MPLRPGPQWRAPALAALCVLGAVWALAGCWRDEPPPRSVLRAAPAATSATEAPWLVQDLMEWMVDPAAGVVFAAAGRLAPTDRRPEHPQAWQAVADAAERLVEQGTLLAQPALAAERADWLGLAGAMQRSAADVAQAARRQDAEAAALAGNALRASCQGCHLRYAAAAAQRLGEAAGTRP